MGFEGGFTPAVGAHSGAQSPDITLRFCLSEMVWQWPGKGRGTFSRKPCLFMCFPSRSNTSVVFTSHGQVCTYLQVLSLYYGSLTNRS